jgi:hypothetical protein
LFERLAVTFVVCQPSQVGCGFFFGMGDVFSADDSSRVKVLLESLFGGQTYSHGKTSTWSEALADGVLEALLMKGYKLIVDVLILEKVLLFGYFVFD